MKILVVGDGHSAIHEVAVEAAFKRLGHKVESFYWQNYFLSTNPLVRLTRRVQNKFLIGPAITKLNQDIIRRAIKFEPKLIFIYRGTHLTAQTLKKIKCAIPSCEIFGYNNDDPFAGGHPAWLWRHFMKCIPHYDIVLAYRKHNISEYIKSGAKKCELLRSWFVPDWNRPFLLTNEEESCYECDVIFIGHYENDGRLSYLEEIVKAGYSLRLYGPPYEWNDVLMQSDILQHLVPTRLVWGDDYSKAISGAKIALCFFSKLNRDTYTRRCFEIPATKTLLLSEYSDDLALLFQQGVEADYFESKHEMIFMIQRYLADSSLRHRVAECGYQRVIDDGHDIDSRMKNVLRYVEI